MVVSLEFQCLFGDCASPSSNDKPTVWEDDERRRNTRVKLRVKGLNFGLDNLDLEVEDREQFLTTACYPEKPSEICQNGTSSTLGDKAMSWNCRGLGKPCAVKALRGLVWSVDHELFLMEIKVNFNRMRNIWQRLGFFDAVVVEADGSSGGLCLCWKDGLELDVLSMDSSMIRVKVTNILHGKAWFGVFVYAPPSRGDRKEFWEHLALEDRYNKPFRFLDAWIRDPECFEVVKDAWKLVNSFPENAQLEADILLEMDEILEHQETIWRQKSREIWLQEGDRNSKFFHASTVIRRKQNFIDSISEDGSRWISGRSNVGNYFLSKFKETFHASQVSLGDCIKELVNPLISEECNEELVRISDAEEIRKVVWSLGQLKSLGPDGMPGRFYRAHWNIVGMDVVDTVKEFFLTGEFHKDLNKTFNVLILKNLRASKFDDFRPISLCNFVYKVIAKILANRLWPNLAGIISPFQSAFVPNH
uniref:Reverse transcriptase n=1 Tax=Cannabis sativa TaxID=3483 RepID=A0A803PIZ5_CANSA